MDMFKLLVIACFAILGEAARSSGVDYYVGNWTAGTNYTTWSPGVSIKFGDSLTFTVSGSEYVVQVSKDEYDNCQWTFPRFNVPVLSKVQNVTLWPRVGDNYYISSVQENCKAGVKLKITVAEPPVYTPKTYTVGDDKGWALGVDYTRWTANKKFYFGDIFKFVFNGSQHTVVEVWEEAFKNCNETYVLPVILPGEREDNGTTIVTVVPPVGKRYYISSSSNDCQNGLKVELEINFTDEAFEPSSSPSGAPSPGGLTEEQSSNGYRAASSCFGLSILLVAAFVL